MYTELQALRYHYLLNLLLLLISVVMYKSADQYTLAIDDLIRDPNPATTVYRCTTVYY